MAVAEKPLTLAEFLELPEEKPALEYNDGVISQKMSPQGQHSVLQLALAQRLDAHARGDKLGRAFPELRATFGGASYVPDVLVYRLDRIPRDAAGRVANDFVEPPDIAVEIVSPQQSPNALVRRCLWYVANGVQIGLLVDPADESVLTFRPDGQVSGLRGTDRIDLGELLPDFELTVEELFTSLQ